MDDFQAEFEKLVQLDQEWRDHFSQTNVPIRQSTEDEEKRQFMFDSLTAGTSLAEFLMEQVRETDLNEEQRALAETIIGNIDDYGYLKATVEEIAASTQQPVEKISEVLKIIQSFDPPGIGAQEFAGMPHAATGTGEARSHWNMRSCAILWKRWANGAFRKSPAAQTEASWKCRNRYRRLPASSRGRAGPFCPTPTNMFCRRCLSQKNGDDFAVTTNDEYIPHLRISNVYKDLMAQGENSSEVKNYIREKIRAGKFLIKSLHQRQQTILNIAKEIVKRQREFMEKGVSCLKPMTMAQIAEVVGVHETTVSRAVSGKYMQTPQGIFEMRFFFTAGLQTASGDGVSNTSVKDMIAEIFKSEDAGKPLSDQEVVKMLSEKGITIARRTVAKYRDELGILPSNLRKVY